MPPKPSSIKVGSVVLPFWLHAEGWRFGWKDTAGKWKYTTRVDKSEALELGRKKARELSNGTVDLGSIDLDQAALVRRFLSLGITHADLDAWQAEQQRPALSAADAVTEFLAVKSANRGKSARNVRSLSGDLGSLSARLAEKQLRAVSLKDLDEWIATYGTVKARRRKNLRSSCVTFFRWCRKRGYLPEDKKTVAEKLESPRISRKVPATWSPSEMRAMLDACPAPYLPWLVLAGFAGMRQEELIIDPTSDKSPLDWADFHWQRRIIIVRAETAKVGERRIVPILPVVRAWLYRERKDSGPVCPADPPYKSRDVKRPSLTSTLGALFGGWRNNALRHSFISYRAAIVGLAQTAMEAGNSESEARRSYHDAMGKTEARKWFTLLPNRSSRKSRVIR